MPARDHWKRHAPAGRRRRKGPFCRRRLGEYATVETTWGRVTCGHCLAKRARMLGAWGKEAKSLEKS